MHQRQQGRHKYFASASDDVAQLLEQLMGLAAKSGHMRTRTGPKDTALRKARVCYNHLAGDMGTHMFDRLIAQGYLRKNGTGLDLTPDGVVFVENFGIDLTPLRAKPAPLCRECLDWSERRPHLAGRLGRALLSRIIDLDWATRDATSRAIYFTRTGERQFQELF